MLLQPAGVIQLGVRHLLEPPTELDTIEEGFEVLNDPIYHSYRIFYRLNHGVHRFFDCLGVEDGQRQAVIKGGESS